MVGNVFFSPVINNSLTVSRSTVGPLTGVRSVWRLAAEDLATKMAIVTPDKQG